MNKIKEFFKKWLWLIITIGLFALGAGTFRLSGYLSEAWFDRTIQNNNKAAQTAVTESQNANANAAIYSQERQTEDAVREKVIAPKLDERRRNSENSKAALEKARRKYNEKPNIENLTSDAVDNCNDLRDIFPGAEFEECDGVPDTRADRRARQSQPK